MNKQIGKIAQEGARNHGLLNISPSDFFERTNCVLPTLPEQQKIASCLSSLDEYISLTKKKLDLLKLHKKGLLQNLFPKNGETKPKFRFPGFEDEWKVVKLGDVGLFISGGTPSTKKAVYWDGSIPWISSSDISIEDGSVTISRYITNEAIANSATHICPQGTILIVVRVGIGKVAIAPCDLCTSQDYYNLIDTNHNRLFLMYSIAKLMKRQAFSSQGTSIKGIPSMELKQLPLPLPSLAEQEQIASCLSSIDNKIAKYDEKLKALEVHKKGLMQKLFPKIN